jgi:tetratricopeptide (TPR) repeat protein
VASLEKIINEIIERIETPKASLLLMKILKEEGKMELAVQACHKVLEIFPDDLNIRKFLAETYFEQGNIDLAALELEKLSKDINELSSIFKLKAEIYKNDDKTREAERSLELYLAHHKDDDEAARLLSELSSPESHEQAALPTPTLAELYFKQGEVGRAIKVYEQVIKGAPDDEVSQKRLVELREMEEIESRRESASGILAEKKLRVIEILEKWLSAVEGRKAGRAVH